MHMVSIRAVTMPSARMTCQTRLCKPSASVSTVRLGTFGRSRTLSVQAADDQQLLLLVCLRLFATCLATRTYALRHTSHMYMLIDLSACRVSSVCTYACMACFALSRSRSRSLSLSLSLFPSVSQHLSLHPPICVCMHPPIYLPMHAYMDL